MIFEGGKSMNKKKDLITNALVIGIIILLFGLAVQPGTATLQPENITTEPKDYLFQTIIDIANNKDVKNLLEQEKNNGFFLDFDYNLRSVFRKLFIKDPNLLRQSIFTKPTLTHEYFNFAYNQGLDLINIIGEDRALEIIESITVTNPNFSNKLSDIIKNNQEINEKMVEIKAMNQQLNPTLPFEGYPIICVILLVLLFTVSIPLASFFGLILLLSSHPFLGPIIFGLFMVFSTIVGIFLELIVIFC